MTAGCVENDANVPVSRITISELSNNYDALLFDAYGVLVHSAGAMPGAHETIEALNQSAKPYAIITNDASKTPDTAATRYQGFGLNIAAERILSSGMLLQQYFDQHELQNADCAVLGTDGSRHYVERAGGNVVSTSDQFDVLVVGDENGYPFVESVDAAITSLFRAIELGRHVRLVLPNPDLIFPHGRDAFGIAAGSVALIIESALRRRFPHRDDLVFDQLGKPHPDLYETAMRLLGSRKAVMIGDQLETDIAGAVACEIDSVLIATGVAQVETLMQASDTQPTYWMSSLEQLS